MYDPYQYNCCRHCSNNPANNPHATGVCFCVLPTMERGGTTRDGAQKAITDIIPQEKSYSTSTKGPKK